MSSNRPEAQEPVTITDKRRINPVTGEVREAPAPPSGGERSDAASPSVAAPTGPASEAPPGSGQDTADALAELTADLQRVQADFANYRRRALRDQQAIADRAKAVVITQLLGVLDDLDRARRHGDLESGPFKSIADKLFGVVQGLGLTAFGEEGDAFDPSVHEAVQHEGDGSNPVIGTVMRRGYMVGDQVVRHAMVGVVDAPLDRPGDEDPAADIGGNAGISDGQAAQSETSAS